MKRNRSIAVFILIATLCVAPARAGSVTGRRETQLGEGVHGTRIWFGGAGANTPEAWALGFTLGGDYTIDNLPAGHYDVAAAEHSWYRYYFGPPVTVPVSGSINVPIRDRSTYDMPGLTDLGDAVSAAQTFIATGRDIAIAMVLSATGGATVQVSIRDGGPEGPIVGPTKTVTHGPLSPPIIRYAPGEVPTVPGRLYAIRQDGVNGIHWRPEVSYAYDPYPNGQAWLDGVYRPEADLRVAIASRDDGLIDEFRVDNGWRSTANYEVVQTFVPAGQELRLAQMMLAGSGTVYMMRASVHPWTGSFPLGPQVGPAKHAMMQADFFQSFVWGAGELPLTPGQAYAIRFVRADGGTFNVYGTSDDYPSGRAYFDGVPDGSADLSGRLIIQEANRGDVAITNLSYTPISATEVSVSFNTDVLSTATVVYRRGSPVFEPMVPAERLPSLTHQVVVRGLSPGTTYDMAVIAHHPARNVTRTAPTAVTTLNTSATITGRVIDPLGPVPKAKIILDQTGQSVLAELEGNFTLANAPTGRLAVRVEAVAHGTQTQEVDVPPGTTSLGTVQLTRFTNLLAGTDTDPLAGWTKYGQFDGQWNSGDWTVYARTGPKWVGSVGNADPKTGGIYRTVVTEAGKAYTVGGWVLTNAYNEPSVTPIQGLAVARIGVDPTGGVNPASPSVIWGRWRFTAGAWKEISVPFMASGGTATLFAEHKHESYYPIPQWYLAAFDDIWVGLDLQRTKNPDADLDGDVDQSDFGQFQACLTGPGVTQLELDCLSFRFDSDDDVDADDMIVFQGCYSGPGELFEPTCVP